ncbi:TrmH family RNA methyltransferase [Saccharicrinis sp. FJH54]|uniref:TrmH family RNA methyltransferase n=1 Tax=Saccharicrinis sp. FJH54 TaxID=3344665 RepID=UPI0035D51B9A
MLSKSQLKYYRALGLKKNRDNELVFVAEGPKLVLDLLPYFKPESILIERKFEDEFNGFKVEVVDSADIQKISLQKHPQGVFAVFKRKRTDLSLCDPGKELILALDDIQDPGNLGTIIRLCDWFGITNIVCSKGTVDVYNPKVVQSTMGALGRINIHYTDLTDFLRISGAPVYGTFLEGEDIYSSDLTSNGIIVMGNEGNGISDAVSDLVTHKLLIPPYPGNSQTSESLNVATATAIVCSEFRRRI